MSIKEHPDREVREAIIKLTDALCMWERETGRRKGGVNLTYLSHFAILNIGSQQASLKHLIMQQATEIKLISFFKQYHFGEGTAFFVERGDAE